MAKKKQAALKAAGLATKASKGKKAPKAKIVKLGATPSVAAKKDKLSAKDYDRELEKLHGMHRQQGVGPRGDTIGFHIALAVRGGAAGSLG